MGKHDNKRNINSYTPPKNSIPATVPAQTPPIGPIPGYTVSIADNELAFRQQLVSSDRELIVQEISERRQCRNTIYLATIGAMATGVIALFTIVQQTYISLSPVNGNYFKMIVPISDKLLLLTMSLLSWLLLFAAIISSIQKTISTNKRVGFLYTLDWFLHQNRIPVYYGGWVNVHRAYELCRAFRKNNKKKSLCGRLEDTDENHMKVCDDRAKDFHDSLNVLTTVVGDSFLSSFTSLTTVIYMVLYVTTTGICITASWIYYRSYYYNELAYETWKSFVVLYIMVLLLASLYRGYSKNKLHLSDNLFDKLWRHNNKERKIGKPVIFFLNYKFWRVISKGNKIILYVASGLFAILLIIYSLKVSFLSESIMISIVAGLISFIAVTVLLYGSIGLAEKVYELRKGRHSPETYKERWMEMLEVCPLCSGGRIYNIENKHRAEQGTYYCLRANCKKIVSIESNQHLNCSCNSPYYCQQYIKKKA